jgi:predicted DNA-binding WGR domain protein
MSESWDVSLQLVDGSSKKFWRGRIEDTTLYVNYGRIGTSGQTQVKQFGSADKARTELDKVSGGKRRKGYDDTGDATAAASTVATLTAAVPVEELDKTATLSFATGGRTIEARLTVDGGVLKTEVTERFAGDEAAAAALGRARKALLDDGWREG